MSEVRLEDHLHRSLCDYPELIDDTLRAIRPGLECLGNDHSTLKSRDKLPNGRAADIVFVEKDRITVVEVKKSALAVSRNPSREDAVDQIVDYIDQCRVKYPGRITYRGFIIGTGIRDQVQLEEKLASAPFEITPLVFGADIPSSVKMCGRCKRAVPYDVYVCKCGAKLR